MKWDRKRLLGYVEPIQLILAVNDKNMYSSDGSNQISPSQAAPHKYGSISVSCLGNFDLDTKKQAKRVSTKDT